MNSKRIKAAKLMRHSKKMQETIYFRCLNTQQATDLEVTKNAELMHHSKEMHEKAYSS